MKVLDEGPEESEVAVVAAVHGDEPCGKLAIEKFLEENPELEKGVKFIIANEEALEKEQRFIDTDLNRAFPGDKESQENEKRLAAKLLEELEGLNVLVLHSMQDFDEPFSLVNEQDEDLLKAPGTDKAVNVKPLDEGSIEKYLDAVSVEAGERGSQEAIENSYEVMKNFLAYFGVLDEEVSGEMPELFEMYEKVSGDYSFLGKNFREVEKGEIYAESEEKELKADQSFYPILMSSEGYEDILGFKGRKISSKDTSSQTGEGSKERGPENELKGER